MLDFMDYIQLAFAEATNWNRDNSYSCLTTTTQSILDFSTPERLRVRVSSLSTPHFATSYTLGTVGLLDGSVSYLFSTVPFHNTPSRSALIPLRKISPGYRQVQAPSAPVETWGWDSILDRVNIPGIRDGLRPGLPKSKDGENTAEAAQRKATLLHASLHLPSPTTLNALFLRRISPTMQLALAVCSTQGPPMSNSAPQASMLAQLSHDTGKYCNEYLFSTDNALFGWRGLWNFGPDPRYTPANAPPALSLLSAGAEAYYSPISSLIGMSTGLRFSTLPAATQVPSASSSSNHPTPISTFPYTLTLTLTPVTGSLSTTYSLRASPNLAFSSRFGFNVYSWESEMVAGCELWRRKSTSTSSDDELAWARRKMRLHDFSASLPGSPPSSPLVSDPVQPDSAVRSHADEGEAGDSVIKLRVDQSWNVRLLWEGRVKELLVSAGVGLGPGSFSSPIISSATSGGGVSQSGGSGPGTSFWRGVGVSVMYSS
ncbi:Protein of unknown function DUF3722 [Penicillium atrosanguineum]|uniref:Mitochondrial distribution and morphology protein 10 n=1 Tax=Penicillium atrosanguineum TaxID=1132637 RepID=A0A9W9PY94_9EURO|nr:uncharacterized protein N7443_002629 [Penicillium atrosanguineum]KAJ5140251.1 Protein of unknown function DUF3722 [Penicillium atrosanguineum]KAJ5310168.1 hypothetical protein N7443_002629 [Penicillium atrosanguineum]KAJ5315684.1 Protein of unknown function DUF3722 [Penicillium atrosanguineum]